MRFLAAKERALAVADAADVFSSVVGGLDGAAFEEMASASGTVEIAVVEFPVGGMTLPVTIVLPPAASAAAGGFLGGLADGAARRAGGACGGEGMGVTRRWGRPWRNRPRHGEGGQMTVEFVVAFPVVVVVAVIAVNAMLFFSECAAFDRVARDAVRVHAASPAYGQGLEQSRASVQAAIEEALAQPYTDVRVAVEGASLGHVTFTATLEFHPTLSAWA